MADQVYVNGNAVSWGSIFAIVDGERYHGFDSITYGDKIERTKAYGMAKSHAPRSRSRGKYSTDPVKLRGPKSTVQALRNAIAAKSLSGASYGNVAFDVVVQFVEGSEPSMTVEIEECKFAGDTSGHEENPDPLKDEIELDCVRIRRNGLTLFEEI